MSSFGLSRLNLGSKGSSPAAKVAQQQPPTESTRKFSGVASTTVERLSEDATSSGEEPRDMWMSASADTFQVRAGPQYVRNKRKEPSAPALMEICGVDLLRTPQRIDNIGSKVTLPEDFFKVQSDIPGVPSVFIVNCQVPSEFPTTLFTEITDGPGWSIVYYFRLTEAARNSMADLASAPNAVKLFTSYCQEAPELDGDPKSKWKGRFKAMFRTENMEQFGLPSFITSYNAKPVLINKTGTLVRGDRYIEMDINLHRFSSVAKKGLQILIPYFERMLVTAGFTIEAIEDDEMPECLFGVATCVKCNNKIAPEF